MKMRKFALHSPIPVICLDAAESGWLKQGQIYHVIAFDVAGMISLYEDLGRDTNATCCEWSSLRFKQV